MQATVFSGGRWTGRALTWANGFALWHLKTAVFVAVDPDRLERLARFLEEAPDVAAFARLPQQFGLITQYTDSAANLRNYEPDFVVATTGGEFYLAETKGREDIDAAHKDRTARIWCGNATLLTGAARTYLKVPEKEFDKLQPTDFADLSVFAQQVDGFEPHTGGR